eukprot:11701145-Prorocentrum_lima.AAC.1
MTVAEKKTFWGKRRVACGGQSITGEDHNDLSEEEDDELHPEAATSEKGADANDEEDIELPDVGGGRGSAKTLAPATLQPIVYHEFPVIFWQGVMHAVSGSTIIDLTPQAGRLAK